MGNICSSCKDCSCFPWVFPSKPNLPPKPETGSLPKPVTPLETDNAVLEAFLAIKGFDFQLDENGHSHHTSEYTLMSREENAKLVARRGQPFKLTLDTNHRYDNLKHKISLVFSVVDSKKTSFGNGTMVGLALDAEGPNGWAANVIDTTETSITLEITTSPSAVVGEWRFDVDVTSGEESFSFPCPSSIFLLFNPWCQEDQVYLEGDAEKQEYILSDTGLIWRGTHNRRRPCIWNYGQFEDDVLECVLYILGTVCRTSASNRADPVKVARAISAGVNSPDDNGVLVGNWSSDYEGGVSPTKWGGSQLILQEFFKTKKPVKYGQCWVFSGVVTSVCRALGIPCRSVTNFSSAHDTHNSLTIDYFFDDEGEVIERLNSDSIWNFHVWNDVWMSRPDLGEDYNGWQAIDATPQEESDGQYRCGPASLVAIKRGEINKCYDVPFVLAEVNADKVFWKYRGPNQPMKLIGKKTEGVGQFVSTKAVGRWIREDVTDLYKFDEDTREEREVMNKALRLCENVFSRYYLNEEFTEVEFDFQLLDDIVIGQPFNVSVVLENKCERDHDVTVTLRADTMLYTGAVKHNVKKETKQITVKACTKETVTMSLSYKEYACKLADQCAFNLACLGKVHKTDFEYFAQDDFRVRKPDIKLQPQGDLVKGRETPFTASLTNPLPVPITKGRFIIQGAGFGRLNFIRLKEKIPVGGEAKVEFTMTPRSAGKKTIVTMFDSVELEDVDGFLEVEVSEDIPKVETNGSGETQPATDDTIIAETTLVES